MNCCREIARRESRREQLLSTALVMVQKTWRPLPLALAAAEREDPESDPDHPLLPVVASAEDTFLACLDAEERRQWVRDRLGRLPEKEREAVVLWGLEDLPYPQVAESLGVPIKTAQKRVERGVGRLRDWRREEGRG